MSLSPFRSWNIHRYVNKLIVNILVVIESIRANDSSMFFVQRRQYRYIDHREDPFEISIQEIKLIHAQRHKVIELMASFNDCFHLASRARSSDDASKSFRVSPLACFRATTRMILSPFPPSLLPAS